MQNTQDMALTSTKPSYNKILRAVPPLSVPVVASIVATSGSPPKSLNQQTLGAGVVLLTSQSEPLPVGCGPVMFLVSSTMNAM
jgi:hypothetical protein